MSEGELRGVPACSPQARGSDSMESFEINLGAVQGVLMESARWGELWNEPVRRRCTHLGVLQPQGLEAGRVQLLTAAPCLDHLLPHEGGDQMVKLPHRRPLRHPCRQKRGKEAADLAGFSRISDGCQAPSSRFWGFFFCHQL